MDHKKLIARLRTESLDSRKAVMSIMDLCMDAAGASRDFILSGGTENERSD